MYRGAGNNAWLSAPATQDEDVAAAPPRSDGRNGEPPPNDSQPPLPSDGHLQYAYYPEATSSYDPTLYYTPAFETHEATASLHPATFHNQGDPYAPAASHLAGPQVMAYEPYSTVHYAHERMHSAVESARWMGTFDYHSVGGASRHQLTTASTTGASPVLGNAAYANGVHNELSETSITRRHSVASSGESGDSPRIGVSGLPLEDDTSLPPPEIKPFVQKLFSMLCDPEHYQDVILWNHAGDAFFVAHNDRFINEVLPNAFGHSNVHSFTRQLNVYNFQRMNVAQLRSALDLQGGIAGAYSGWSHPRFRRGDASTLAYLTPRPSRARLIRKLEKQYGGSSTSGSASASASSGASSSASSMGPISPRSSASMRLGNAPPPLSHFQPPVQAPIDHPSTAPDPPYP